MTFNGFDNFAKSNIFEGILNDSSDGRSSLFKRFNIAFVCFYGSRNYNLETEKSDYDFYIVYYPTFDNFFENKFERFSVIEKDYDYFLTPFHEYVSHAMKGNIKFIEPFICGTIFFVKKDAAIFNVEKARNYELFEDIKRFINMNYGKNFKAAIGIVNNKKLNIIKDQYTSNTLKYKDTRGYDIKEAINSLRIIFLLENYLKSGEFSFAVENNPVYSDFEKYMAGINTGEITKNQYLEIINEKIKIIEELDRNKQKDDSAKFNLREAEGQRSSFAKLEKKINDSIKKLCRDNACFAKKP